MAGPELAYEDTGNWTYRDYKDWELKPGERREIINGVAYAMPAPNTEHKRISTFLSGKFISFLKGKIYQLFAAPFDVRLFYKEDESDNTVVKPDLIVVCDPEKLGKEGCRGAPDLVIEILFPSNTAMAMRRKVNIYREAGVQEVWIIDPEDKDIDIYRLEYNCYVLNNFKNGDILHSQKFPGLEIPLDVLFAADNCN